SWRAAFDSSTSWWPTSSATCAISTSATADAERRAAAARSGVLSELAQRIEAVRKRIGDAARRAGRAPGDGLLVAVSKRHPAELVRQAHGLGVRSFGENYAQELVAKAARVGSVTGIQWHMIGHLQTNKARLLAPVVACIETVDSAALASELAKR